MVSCFYRFPSLSFAMRFAPKPEIVMFLHHAIAHVFHFYLYFYSILWHLPFQNNAVPSKYDF